MKNKIIKKIAIIGLLATSSTIVLSSIPNLSHSVLAATKSSDSKKAATKSSDSKKTDAKSNDSKSNSSNSSSDESPSGTQNPTEIPESTLVKPSSYPYWLQYWGPWSVPGKFGATGTGGAHWTAPLGNGGCVVTSMAIQGARGGLTERAAGKPFNPLWNKEGSDFAVGSFSYGGKGMHVIGGTPAPSGGNLSAAQVLAECKKIASAGNYPLIRGNGNQHTVAYWKAGNGKALVYDPSRMSTGNYFAPPYNNVVALEVTGKGTKKFSEDSPGPNQSNSSSNSSNSSSSKSGDSSSSGDSGSGVGAYKIKPVFNPFYSPAVHYIPADEQDNQSQTNAQVMQAADGMLPEILGSLRVFVGFTAYVYAMLAIIAILIALVDLQLGGILQERILSKSGPMTKALFMPGGNFMGVDDGRGTVVSGKNPALTIVKNGTKHYAALLIILTLVASGSMSWIIGNAIALIGNLFGLG